MLSLALKWECKLSGNIFITDDCRIISELLECLGGGLVYLKGSNAQKNTLLIKTASTVQEIGMWHGQCWAAVLTPRPHIPGRKHFLAQRNWFLSHPVCSDWISTLAIMSNSPCQQWLITCPGCRHQPRGGDLLGWYWVGQRRIWMWRWQVLHDITNLFHNPLSYAQVFSVLPVTFLQLLTKEIINTNASMQNFGGEEIFLLFF